LKGEIITALYSFDCPELRQFGAEKFIFNFLKDPAKSKIAKARTILQRLEPYLFYLLIAKESKLKPFDLKVARAHWLGNELLKEIKEEDIKECFSKILSHDMRILKIVDLIGGLPHHNFDALWILKRTKKLTKDLQKEVTDCLIRAGRVIEIEDGKILVEIERIDFEDFRLRKSKEKISKFFLREVKIGDFVSIHFKKAREKISLQTVQNLRKITKKALSFFEE
jgi:hypothetical protein